MLKKADVEAKINLYFSKNYGDFAEEFEIFLKPLGAVSVESETIKNLINCFHLASLKDTSDATSRMYQFAKTFAVVLKEEDYVKELENIYFGKVKWLLCPVPDLEIFLRRDLKNSVFSGKKRYSINGKIYGLSSLNRNLESARAMIIDIFYELATKYNIDVGLEFGDFKGMSSALPDM